MKFRRLLQGSAIFALSISMASPMIAQASMPQEDSIEPFHPSILWASSEEKNGEKKPNGTISALTDSDGGVDSAKTFWTTKWQSGYDNFPHILAIKNNTNREVCGIQYTARPSYESVQGNSNAPGVYSVFAFDKDPGNPSDKKDINWRSKVHQTKFNNGEFITTGGLKGINEPQIISFKSTNKPILTLVGFKAVDSSKKDMSASDIKLVPCLPVEHMKKQGQGDAAAAPIDFFIDQLPFGAPGKPVTFSPSQYTYESTAYYHTASVSARVKLPTGATATINGRKVDSDGRVSGIPLTKGVNVIVAKVVVGNAASTYVVNVTKVDTDFRGNEKINATVKINGANDNDNLIVTDGMRATSWNTTSLKDSAEWSNKSTGFTIHLNRPRYVGRIQAYGWPTMPAGSPGWQGGHSVAIDVKVGDNWNTVVTNASLTRDSDGLWYWDLNGYHKTQDIRVWLNKPKIHDPQQNGIGATGMRLEEVEVWGLPEGKNPKEIKVPDEKPKYTSFNANENKYGVNRAQALALQYGVLLPTWVPSEGYGRGVYNDAERRLTGGSFPMFYDKPLFNAPLMQQLGKGVPWSLAKAPKGGNSMGENSVPKDFLTEEMKPYANSLVDIQYGDEGGYSESEVQKFSRWFSWSKNRYPGAIVHSNQALGLGWETHSNMSHFVKTAKPDLVSWDTYYYGANQGPRPSKIVANMLQNKLWTSQRQAALEGLTGDCSQPVLFGQYLDYNWDANVSASQKSIVPMVGLATGQKWFGLFRMEYNAYDRSSIIDQDGAPTRSFYEFSSIFKDVRGLGKYLVAMNNEYAGLKSGIYADRASAPNIQGFRMGAFDSAEGKLANAEFGLQKITVKNVGTVNNGKPGDVLVGHFSTLKNLNEKIRKKIFGESKYAPKALLVVNALTGDTRYPSYYLSTRTDNGSYAETAQDITLTVKRPSRNAILMQVDPRTYTAKTVPLKDGDDEQDVKLERVGGGCARLLYWLENNAAYERKKIEDIEPKNIAKDKNVIASQSRTELEYSAKSLTDGDRSTRWAAPDNPNYPLTLDIALGCNAKFDAVQIEEFVEGNVNHRIKKFSLWTKNQCDRSVDRENSWERIYEKDNAVKEDLSDINFENSQYASKLRVQIDEVYPNVDMYNGHPGSPTISEIKVISKTEQRKTPKPMSGSSVLDPGGVSTDSTQLDDSYGPSVTLESGGNHDGMSKAKRNKSMSGSSVLDPGGVSTDSTQLDNSYGPSDSNVSGLRMTENEQSAIRKNGLRKKREKCSRGMLVAGGSSVTGILVLALTFFAFYLLVRRSRKVRQE